MVFTPAKHHRMRALFSMKMHVQLSLSGPFVKHSFRQTYMCADRGSASVSNTNVSLVIHTFTEKYYKNIYRTGIHILNLLFMDSSFVTSPKTNMADPSPYWLLNSLAVSFPSSLSISAITTYNREHEHSHLNIWHWLKWHSIKYGSL